jgi:hypothetical protein
MLWDVGVDWSWRRVQVRMQDRMGREEVIYISMRDGQGFCQESTDGRSGAERKPHASQ